MTDALPRGAGPTTLNTGANDIRVDLQLVADLIPPETRVLDIGCGDGALLDYLARFKRVDGRGIEISQAGVNACVSNGLSVIQGNAETDLKDYPSDAFDYVILSQTLQAMHNPRTVLAELVRIGRRAILSFPNFAYWKVRLFLGLRGRMPVTATLPFSWYDTPNIHHCTIHDFVALATAMDIEVERGFVLGSDGRALSGGVNAPFANLRGVQSIYVLARRS